ncbi:MAG: DEAD/DEAH box helicase [Acidobacteria bacterium]|nr:DEAD/DEAH box helicase [Acidobacteriota bacterium]MCB9397221.1 DEAD/DEAH box helicase [Acidobacteriota bacterium]
MEGILESLSFQDLGLSAPLLKALEQVGYESPSPIQERSIPVLLAGRDLIGQAQTGTGKTAAFALPCLSKLTLNQVKPQVLVLTPTRELAIQVAEAFRTYAQFLDGFQILPIYGGQDYQPQIRGLKRGAHVVVGTPGRIMDHMEKGTLQLDQLAFLVLDEADEMLRMGFINDVEWILEQTPKNRQTALFSATMPPVIRRIAQNQLNDPAEVTIEVKTATVQTIRQRFVIAPPFQKLEALTRILEHEPFDAMIIFVRTKTATTELSDKLSARGYRAAALNGDIAQNRREKTIEQLKNGVIDVLVATDVAARGLDVGRISHVVNYDIPYDTESYIHRIGRTGRAGQSGDAILFVGPREQSLMRALEKATKKPIDKMNIPTSEDINQQRVQRFKQKISDALNHPDLSGYQALIHDFQVETGVSALDISAALASLLQRDQPLVASEEENAGSFPSDFASNERKAKKGRLEVSQNNVPYRIEVGHVHGVKPGNIVGAIANESGLDSRNIGRIRIHFDYALVDLPADLPKPVLKNLKKTQVLGQALNIRLWESRAPQSESPFREPFIPSDKSKKKARKKEFEIIAKPRHKKRK